MCHKKTIMSDATNKKCPRSPFRRRNIGEPQRPRLSRRVIATARVNLNSYWSKFEELSKENVPLATQQMPTAFMFSTYHDNAINENLINEILDLCKN
ncbi:unnamed protein product [Ceutorhynchus assimilis]|uniref:Uncharacterized protein n=1 Tax=Ceutorhynchus assimilis TaxID=467358 RepID=A0A9N9QEJ6_9CUCU|nr:unnamed protein product [Ceutorhynchus assimilis]